MALIKDARNLRTVTGLEDLEIRKTVRKVLSKINKRKLDPRDVVFAYSKIQDVKLTSYVLGLSENTIRSCVEGELFPEGMLFTNKYIARFAGVGETSIGSNSPANSLSTREEAMDIVFKFKHRIFREKYLTEKEVLAAFGSGGKVSNAIKGFGIDSIVSAGFTYYDKSQVMEVSNVLWDGSNVMDSLGEIARKVGTKEIYIKGSFYRYMNTPDILCDGNIISGDYFYGLYARNKMPKEYVSIIRGIDINGLSTGEAISKIRLELHNELYYSLTVAKNRIQKGKKDEEKNYK